MCIDFKLNFKYPQHYIKLLELKILTISCVPNAEAQFKSVCPTSSIKLTSNARKEKKKKNVVVLINMQQDTLNPTVTKKNKINKSTEVLQVKYKYGLTSGVDGINEGIGVFATNTVYELAVRTFSGAIKAP